MRVHTPILGVFVLLLLGVGTGCSSSNQVTYRNPITVEGRMQLQGNSPFEALCLITDDRNTYVLVFDGERPGYSGPQQFRVSGELYKGDWNGRPFAHIRVDNVEPVSR